MKEYNGFKQNGTWFRKFRSFNIFKSPSSILVRNSRNLVIIIFLQANTEVRVPLQ